MRISLRYRGIEYERNLSISELTSEETNSITQRSQIDTLNQVYVVLRYRGILYIRCRIGSNQSNEILFLRLPAAVSKLAGARS